MKSSQVTETPKSYELALFKLNQNEVNTYQKSYSQFYKDISSFNGYEELQTYQQVDDHTIFLDFCAWKSLAHAESASDKVKKDERFAQLFSSIENVLMFEHLTFKESFDFAPESQGDLLELHVYKVENENRDALYRARHQFFSQLDNDNVGLLGIDCFELDGTDVLVDLVRWEDLSKAQLAHMKYHGHEKFNNMFSLIRSFELFKQMEKLDLSRETFSQQTEAYYQANDTPEKVMRAARNMISILGQSSWESETFASSIAGIYQFAKLLKVEMSLKNQNFVMAHLEAKWWAEGGKTLDSVKPDEWCWKLMIPVPDSVVFSDIDEIKLNYQTHFPTFDRIVFESEKAHNEVRILHKGSYMQEKDSIEKIFNFIGSNDLKVNGVHHEIYLNDPKVVKEEDLRTIISYNVE
ncbi:GyrI-like domain-containing protein [Aureibacter tunicatorum]|uniref:GyrI-like small molecule binding domain-containing protein n=1 Tax=Aureibacter tunicatorum TaxID=866807 RepID=A0AAE3XS72_9BACT|nr:GyrI-like domain-containing protein [Aureibacter tunicatorum]MDR6240931.1 hypothetical protein [Aureibacter tunicatorum]BDD03711.1 hypothetical protein AUTU_11940 [Aureibacter tunicatorum]